MKFARMAESVDALVSNTNDSNVVPVRSRLRVLFKNANDLIVKSLAFFGCLELGKYWALSASAVKIFSFSKYKINRNLSAETGVLRCYGRQRATNLYFSGSREQIVKERRRDLNAGMFAMVHRDQRARRRIALFLFTPLGAYVEENLEIQARHGTGQHRKVLFIEQVFNRCLD